MQKKTKYDEILLCIMNILLPLTEITGIIASQHDITRQLLINKHLDTTSVDMKKDM